MTDAEKKQKLIVLSDLWGWEESNWIGCYQKVLNKHFDVYFYDSAELGGVIKTNSTEISVHQQFLDFGIDKAVSNLLLKEKEPVHILAFSIGGLISWRAAVLGLPLKTLFALSSTRLRYETERPLGNLVLYYAEKDPYIPSDSWFMGKNISKHLLKNENHDFYKKPDLAPEICDLLINMIRKDSGNTL